MMEMLEDDECTCPECTGRAPDVVAVHRDRSLAILENLHIVPVTNWFNRQGEECPPALAVSCVCGAEGYGWYAIDLTTFGYATVH